MNIKNICCTALVISGLVFTNGASAQNFKKERNYLHNEYQQEGGEAAFSGVPQWREARYKSIMDKIAALPETARAELRKAADQAMTFTWPTLPATTYL